MSEGWKELSERLLDTVMYSNDVVLKRLEEMRLELRDNASHIKQLQADIKELKDWKKDYATKILGVATLLASAVGAAVATLIK